MLSLNYGYICSEKHICTCPKTKFVSIRKELIVTSIISQTNLIRLLWFSSQTEGVKTIKGIFCLPYRCLMLWDYPHIQQLVSHLLPLLFNRKPTGRATELPMADGPIWWLVWRITWLVLPALLFFPREMNEFAMFPHCFYLSLYSSVSPAVGP